MSGVGFNEAGVPDELKERNQWLLWSANSDPPKRPLNAGGHGASWNDPNDWLPFDEAVALAQTDEFDGIGYVISEGDPYIGLDLDGCLREPFQEKPKGWLPSLDDFQGTYVEYSQSGTGLHPFVRGDRLPEWWSDSHFTDDEHEGVEAYTSKFFIVTGRPVDALSAPSIEEVDVAPFLSEAYETINGEAPRLPGGDDRPAGDTAVDLGIYDVINRSAYPEGENASHPFHPSGTGTNFRVDPGGETFRCWRHDVTGNGLHLLGISEGVIGCGDWANGLDSETWREIFDAGREAGYSIPEPDGPEAAPDGGAAAVSGASAADEYESIRDRVKQRVLIPLDPEKDGSDQKRIKHDVAVDRFTDILLDEYDFVRPREDTRGWRDKLYVYEEESGIYEAHGEYFIESEAERLLGDFATNQRVNEIVGKVERTARVNPKLLRTDPDRLVVGNGILNLITGELDEHTPSEYHKTSLKWDYDPEAECPRIDEFFHDIVDGGGVDTLYRLVAHCIYREYAAEKAAMLLGEGQNGKSVFIDLLERFLGRYNVANQSLQALNMKDFSANNLVGKLANFHPDLSDQTVKTMQMFKKLTGRDTIDADVKFERPVKFENFATLIFACNRMPVIEDDTRGNWRRWILIQFPNTFERSDDDYKEKRELMAELTAEGQMEGLLARAVDEIQEWANGRRWFPKAPHWKETRRQIRRAAEPVYDFAHICLRESRDDDAFVTKDDARQCYRDYASLEGLPPMDREEFGDKLLNQTDLDITSGQKRIKGKRRHVYKGVEFSERGKQLLDDVEEPEADQESLDGGPAERADFVVRYVSENSSDGDYVEKNDLLNACSGFGMSYDAALDAIDKAASRGDIIRTPDNEKYYN